jgi:hypothetical protein
MKTLCALLIALTGFVTAVAWADPPTAEACAWAPAAGSANADRPAVTAPATRGRA